MWKDGDSGLVKIQNNWPIAIVVIKQRRETIKGSKKKIYVNRQNLILNTIKIPKFLGLKNRKKILKISVKCIKMRCAKA